MSKRKSEEPETDAKKSTYGQKHSLDSDEEDATEEDNILDERDIEGEEEGNELNIDGQRMTAFNMREEMEEGHFDRDGHFIWKHEKEVRDNWLDNIDWQKIAPVNKYKLDTDSKGLGEESSDEEKEEPFDEIETYKLILTYLKEGESINKALNRLGGDTKKLSSIERLRRKKAGTLTSNKEVTELTELANKILSEKGNMNIYQETYENIKAKISKFETKGKTKAVKEPMLDMYADDFDSREKQHLQEMTSSNQTLESNDPEEEEQLKWVFKWKQDDEKIEGPFSTEQMAKWASEGYFKSGVWVRKYKENTSFYSSNRVDFELYL